MSKHTGDQIRVYDSTVASLLLEALAREERNVESAHAELVAAQGVVERQVEQVTRYRRALECLGIDPPEDTEKDKGE